jgi:hypothetical protein
MARPGGPDSEEAPLPDTSHRIRWAAGAALLLAGAALFTNGGMWRDPLAAAPGGAPRLAMAGGFQAEPARGIRSGFTKTASEAIHGLVEAFESERIDIFAGLVDVDYDLDYHRMLHDLESDFETHEKIRLDMQLVGVEPMAVGFTAEVKWEKTYQVKRTRHQVHQEGVARLVFSGDLPPRLKGIRSEMPF